MLYHRWAMGYLSQSFWRKWLYDHHSNSQSPACLSHSSHCFLSQSPVHPPHPSCSQPISWWEINGNIPHRIYSWRLAKINCVPSSNGYRWLTHWPPGRCGINFKSIIFKLNIQNRSCDTHWEITPVWMPQNLTNERSMLVQVMFGAIRPMLTHIYVTIWHKKK